MRLSDTFSSLYDEQVKRAALKVVGSWGVSVILNESNTCATSYLYTGKYTIEWCTWSKRLQSTSDYSPVDLGRSRHWIVAAGDLIFGRGLSIPGLRPRDFGSTGYTTTTVLLY